MKKTEASVEEILKSEAIYAVYQPIVCLQTSAIFAYEALSRIDEQVSKTMNIAQLFTQAKQVNRLWELEKICRSKAMAGALIRPQGTKLFLNIDPDIIADQHFSQGFTAKKIAEYGFRADEIVFELSEQSPITDQKVFENLMTHYKQQHFQIAIDDFGIGYSGFKRIQNVQPEFIKIDISIITNIDTDPVKQAIVESLVHLSQKIGAELIAEGIETQAELKTVLTLGVRYAQGYYIQRPQREFTGLNEQLQREIVQANSHQQKRKGLGIIEHLAIPKATLVPEQKAKVVYKWFREQSNLNEYCIVTEDDSVIGVVTRKQLLELFSGQYGYNLHAKKTIAQVMERHFLAVESTTTIEEVAKRAMGRPNETMYDAVIVTKNKKYLGVVTIQHLLAATIDWQIMQAKDANPLTQLPGNNEVKRQIINRLDSNVDFAVMYFDLDAFKAYNDVYGFEQGDKMIQALAKVLLKHLPHTWFTGHIGGDDFVVIGESKRIQQFCQSVFASFAQECERLYGPLDRQRGYIQAKNRDGMKQRFALATISVAAITNQSPCLLTSNKTVETVSEKLAETKKASKTQRGNSLVIV